MRRSLRRMSNREVAAYPEAEHLFTTLSLEEAKEKLAGNGLELSEYCFHSWVRDGVRFFRVWEDKRLKESVARAVPFGHTACTLKRAEAEKLYIKAKRYKGDTLQFDTDNGVLQVIERETGEVKLIACLPATGGALVFEQAAWNEEQAAHFVNVVLVRDQPVDEAFAETAEMQ